MRILAVDPGNTVGWVIFDTESCIVLATGKFPFVAGWQQAEFPSDWMQQSAAHKVDTVVIEWPTGQGFTRPTMVGTGIITGQIIGCVHSHGWLFHYMPRHEVKVWLRRAVYKSIEVFDDATVRQAFQIIFGDDCFHKGRKQTKTKSYIAPGRFAGVTGHSAAALALAVGWSCEKVPGFLERMLDFPKATK